jgi:hypothetical protein
MFTKTTKPTPAITLAHLLLIVRALPRVNCRQLVPGTRHVLAEVAQIIALKTTNRDAGEIIFIGMTPAEIKAI